MANLFCADTFKLQQLFQFLEHFRGKESELRQVHANRVLQPSQAEVSNRISQKDAWTSIIRFLY
jgi:hypothetical protein